MSEAFDVAGGLPRNYLRSCLLLLLGEGSAHGYELLERLGTLGLTHADTGGVYRALRSMEAERLVRSWWEPSTSGPTRRRYELTDAGAEWLAAWAGTLREVHGSLDTYLQRYGNLDSAAGSPGGR